MNTLQEQGQRKLFKTGQAKLHPKYYSIKCLSADNFTIADILFQLVTV